MKKYVVKRPCYWGPRGKKPVYLSIGKIVEYDENVVVPSYFEPVSEKETVQSNQPEKPKDQVSFSSLTYVPKITTGMAAGLKPDEREGIDVPAEPVFSRGRGRPKK